MERVITYIDGFNLYFGLRESGFRRYLWLNLVQLSTRLVRPSQKLVYAKYFTARIANPPDKQRRQAIYLEALSTLSDLQIFYGKYQLNQRKCRSCGYTDRVPSEKMTDVNIAVELLSDAFQDYFDTALLISADSDLCGPIEAVLRLFPTKRVVVAFPPSRNSAELTRVASAYLRIGRAALAGSQFSDEVVKPDGYILRRPTSWR
ncbi:NYN domain-containing protein [Candidatus Chloroploca sp. M-50]|uniref:NYN domain-containing protein n=1 Tax=Candidatus Chloroploca mongolica TaxID=2528176 RepID=A0ABS4D9Y3_9CHLR|nr:NYN domain-containing protein [Candidatus Chloroploca mongolica]MBP1466251.1 NYN domain-containing protein [Candidatus Chloroploca mongolica]